MITGAIDMKLIDLLKIYDSKIEDKKFRVVRHQMTDSPWVEQLLKDNLFELYQATQQGDKFKSADYLISFTELPHNRALFRGIFKINRHNGTTKPFPSELSDYIWENEKWANKPVFTYEIEKIDNMAELERRLIIIWDGGRTWVRKMNYANMEVSEILPIGYFKPFTGYQNVLLTFEELDRLIKNPIANREWEDALSVVFGIYVILDTVEWKQYIGKASGDDGIWGRWSTYAKYPYHGGDKGLVELLDKDPDRYKHFQYSILMVLPKESAENEVLKAEALMKKKLGTRDNGYNRN